jgi:hypothetical protein
MTMQYQFCIQVSSPRLVSEPPNESEIDTLSDAIEALYLLETERAYISWNWINVPLSYKYDVSVIVDDVVSMLSGLLSSDTGECAVTWPSSVFHATWDLRWRGDELTIRSHWEAVSGGGRIEALLNAHSDLKVSRPEFLGEWASLLAAVVDGLSSRYLPKSVTEELDEARRVLSRIALRGVLYRA